MVPAAIRRQLGRLWARERMLDLAWGAARLVTLVTLLLFGCGLIDWFIDREQDTPEALRRLLSYLQIGAAGMAIYWFLLRPWRKRLTWSALALRVEDKYPQLQHRLISA